MSDRGFAGVAKDLSAGLLLLLLTGCASLPQAVPSPAGVTSASILDSDPSSTRYALYRRDPEGAWFFGGGADAFAERAEILLEMRAEDRHRIAALMEEAGWLDPAHIPSAGAGPRRLEVGLVTENGRRRFTVTADGRVFSEPVEALLRTLKAVADRRFGAVIDALPQGRRGG